MKRAFEKHEAKEAQVILIILRDMNWRSGLFRKLEAIPINGKAVTTWGNRDSAWKNVEGKIREVIEDLIEKNR